MNLFGCKFCDATKPDGNGNKKNSHSAAYMMKFENMSCDRKNFDSLLWATVTVFQVSIQSPLELLKVSKSHEVIVSSKILTKYFKDFCPSL